MDYVLTRFLFQRLLAAVYFVGFLIAVNQFTPLLGRRGLLPVKLFVKRIDFWDSPSLFWFWYSDGVFKSLAWIGLILSFLAVVGISDLFATWFSVLIWFLLWVLYLSFVNVGQTFYGFGWESLLLEIGFLAIFLGPLRAPASVVMMWLLRWVLFRVMFGAGLIKLRGDPCWRDLTCLQFHYETQPLPNPLSRYFHHFPVFIHRAGVVFNHFVELIVPFGYFGPQPVRITAGILTIAFQFILILSGNLSWLNVVTVVLAISCFDDVFLTSILSLFSISFSLGASTLTGIPMGVTLGLAAVVSLLSIKPVLNLFSPHQYMNTSFEPLHLVNTYGAFGSVTRERTELIIEGTLDSHVTKDTKWKEYGFKGKPGDIWRRPPQVTPYHYKIDWQMWFAAMSPYYRNPWLLNLIYKLLKGQNDVEGLLQEIPFPQTPPRFIRVLHYSYKFTNAGDKAWWKRELIGEYLPPLSLQDASFRDYLEERGWLEEEESP